MAGATQFLLRNDNHDEKMRFVQRGFYTTVAAYCSQCPTAQMDEQEPNTMAFVHD